MACVPSEWTTVGKGWWDSNWRCARVLLWRHTTDIGTGTVRDKSRVRRHRATDGYHTLVATPRSFYRNCMQLPRVVEEDSISRCLGWTLCCLGVTLALKVSQVFMSSIRRLKLSVTTSSLDLSASNGVRFAPFVIVFWYSSMLPFYLFLSQRPWETSYRYPELLPPVPYLETDYSSKPDYVIQQQS